MPRQQSDTISAPLARLQRRFTKWRGTRRRGERIPAPLWRAAARIAEDCGLHPTASALGLDYYSLKKRMVQSPKISAPATPFLELPTIVRTPGGECVIELQDGMGASIRVHIKGASPVDVLALSRGFWGVQ